MTRRDCDPRSVISAYGRAPERRGGWDTHVVYREDDAQVRMRKRSVVAAAREDDSASSWAVESRSECMQN